MAFNLAWIKEHKGIVAGVVLGAILLIYIAKRSGGTSASSGVAGALQAQQAGQLQMAQLNAQLSAQGNQTQAQLEAEQISTNAQQQSTQDQSAEQIALYGLQGHLYEDQLNAQVSEQQSLLPLEEKILSVNPSSLYGHTAEQQTLENELALLLTRGSVAGNLPATYAPGSGGSAGFTLNIPGLGNLGVGGI
jgi:hypothetical protein